MQGDDVSLASRHVYENGNLLPKVTVVMSPVWSSTKIATKHTWLGAHAFGKNELAIDEWHFVKRDPLGPA